MPARVLIVEDERIVAAAIEHQLELDGYHVVSNVGSGEAAVAAAARHAPDIVLMDIKLDGEMDGIAASAQIRERVGAPVIFLTAYSDNATLHDAGATAPFSYLVKPVQERQLRPAIEMALYRHRLERERDALVAQLQQAATEIERLRGFLPVCAWCRKVRNDDGYWQDLVGYLSERFGAVVTHGLCDDCLVRYGHAYGLEPSDGTPTAKVAGPVTKRATGKVRPD